MSDTLKKNLISYGNTFFSSFILSVGASLTMLGQIEWTTSFWIGIALTAVRAGVAEVVKSFTPVRLGGRRS